MFSRATSPAYDMIKPYVWAAALAFLIGFCGVLLAGGGAMTAQRAHETSALPAAAPVEDAANPARAA